MQIAVSGSHGLVGSALLQVLEQAGHEVHRLVRSTPKKDEIRWDWHDGTIDRRKLEGVEAVVHLAGDNIAEGRWTEAKKARIRDSRVKGTALISEALAQLEHKPRVLVCASAIGYYGHRPGEVCDEQSAAGEGFLPDVCKAWEAATLPALDTGIRVVNLRIGMVLSSQGGALKKMLLPFKLGVGGVVGSGRQHYSWVALDDLIRAVQFALDRDTLVGPVNIVAPNVVTNRVFTKTLGRVLGRPTIFPLPAFAARLAFGEMADDLLLGDNHIVPAVLTDMGFEFQYPMLEEALRHLLKRN